MANHLGCIKPCKFTGISIDKLTTSTGARIVPSTSAKTLPDWSDFNKCKAMRSFPCNDVLKLNVLLGTNMVGTKFIQLVVSTHLKNISQNGDLPQMGVRIKEHETTTWLCSISWIYYHEYIDVPLQSVLSPTVSWIREKKHVYSRVRIGDWRTEINLRDGCCLSFNSICQAFVLICWHCYHCYLSIFLYLSDQAIHPAIHQYSIHLSIVYSKK